MTSYRLAPPVPSSVAEEFSAYGPLVSQLLFNRGISVVADAERFLFPDYDTGRHDPFLFSQMERAVERILRAMRNNERIVVWSDYDCDGIPGGVLLHDFFKAVGYENFENYIPHRHDEGYGMNTSAVLELAESGTRLIITIDCGTTDYEPIRNANDRGIDVIITDHHEPVAVLPEAYAILNPKCDESYPFKGLCGTGVAWKLIEALLLRGAFEVPKGREKWWLDVVGLATLADMVPLVGENRIFAHYGLLVMRKTRRRGLAELMKTLRVAPRHLSEDDIGFMIAPRINAASRMGSPFEAFRVFTTESGEEAVVHAAHLDRINNERKGVVASMVKDIKKKLRESEPVIVAGDPLWRPSLLGLAANALVETYRRPAFLWGRDGRSIIKGSCRSDGSVSVVLLMRELHDILIDYGGHHASGGFALMQEHVHTFSERINAAYVRMSTQKAAEAEVVLDADLRLEDVTDALHRDIFRLSPFGEGNRKPLFRFHDVTPVAVEQFGKKRDHTRILFRTGERTIEAIAFFKSSESFNKELLPGTSIDLIANVERSYFMNRPQLRLRIVDAL